MLVLGAACRYWTYAMNLKPSRPRSLPGCPSAHLGPTLLDASSVLSDLRGPLDDLLFAGSTWTGHRNLQKLTSKIIAIIHRSNVTGNSCILGESHDSL
jgi:hypothetical protein